MTHREYEKGVRDGVFIAIQELIITHDQPTLAEEIAGACAMNKKTLLYLSRLSGYETKKVNKAIRDMKD